MRVVTEAGGGARPQVRLKDSLVSSLQFCKAKDMELAWIDGVLDMRVIKVDTGVVVEEGELKDEAEEGELPMEVSAEMGGDHNAVAQQRAMKTLFGEDEREASEESDVIPTLEPLPSNEVRWGFPGGGGFHVRVSSRVFPICHRSQDTSRCSSMSHACRTSSRFSSARESRRNSSGGYWSVTTWLQFAG